jgi:hypothetical protein
MGPPRHGRARKSSNAKTTASTSRGSLKNRTYNGREQKYDNTNTSTSLDRLLSRSTDLVARPSRHVGESDAIAVGENEDEDGKNLVDSIQDLLEKERVLGELRLREKEQQVLALQERLECNAKGLVTNNGDRAAVSTEINGRNVSGGLAGKDDIR